MTLAHSSAPLVLEIRPAAGRHRTGEPLALEALVRRPDGGDASGVVIDFEVTEGPGDDDIGTGGHTPEAPDLSCTTAGDPTSGTASCTAAYTEQDNERGDDAVLAWIDADGLDTTIEADLQEGADQLAPGPAAAARAPADPAAPPSPPAATAS